MLEVSGAAGENLDEMAIHKAIFLQKHYRIHYKFWPPTGGLISALRLKGLLISLKSTKYLKSDLKSMESEMTPPPPHGQ